METKHRRRSILMMPWLAQGHLLPYFELAKKLSHQNFIIYICSTPINLRPIKENLSNHPKFSSSIQLIDLQLPSSFPELTPQYHTTKDLPRQLFPFLLSAFDLAKPEFCNILKAYKPDLLIYDFFQPWAPQAAHDLKIEAVLFVTCSSASLSFLFHHIRYPSRDFPFRELSVPATECEKLNGFIWQTTNDVINKDRFMGCFERSSKMILIKTSTEIEAKYIDYLSLLTGKQIVPVGFLIQEPANIYKYNETAIMNWLSKKEPSSVVFVSFGSEYLLSREEMIEIADGLELSKVGFIWVVRFIAEERITINEVLPEGFLERIGERGMIVEGWAPQAKILEHSSIGGFVSHCGWGSTTEAMMFGVPIVAIPMFADQPFNAKLVIDIGVGMEVPKENEKLNGKEVARVIREVVLKEEGKQLRRRAKELSNRLREEVGQRMDVVTGQLVQLV